MNPDELRNKNLELLSSVSWGCLATVDSQGDPQTRAVCNLRYGKDYPGLAPFFNSIQNPYETYIATDRSSPKMEQIRNDPRCSLFFCNPQAWHGLTLCGRLQIIEDLRIKHQLWVDGWTHFYPGKHEDPEYTILKLKPEILKGWHFKENFYQELDKSS
jgi:general stress protein 26